MTDRELELESIGLNHEQIAAVSDMFDRHSRVLAIEQAAELLHRIFLRVERDSAAGCALRRALGFSSPESLARAAASFAVTKQYLWDLQADLERRLGDRLAFLSRPSAIKNAGPSFDHSRNR